MTKRSPFRRAEVESCRRWPSVEVGGVTFTAVMERDGVNGDGEAKFRHVQVNGRLLWAIPGGLMAHADDLPRIAKALKSG